MVVTFRNYRMIKGIKQLRFIPFTYLEKDMLTRDKVVMTDGFVWKLL